MSWLNDFTGQGPAKRSTVVDDGIPKVPDINGNMVSSKNANQPFLAHQRWRAEEAARKEAKELRKKERAQKLARGEAVGPEEPDDDEEEIGCLGFIKFLVHVVVFILFASKFVTGDWLWDYRGKWTNPKTYIPSKQQVFTEASLAKYDGSNPDLPILIAIDSTVYDVSENKRSYGLGGSYNHMAGVDATRAYGTGCFKEHRTHDIRGLTEAEMKGVNHWIKFFKDHQKYHKVGSVTHEPIDPNAPIPPGCKPVRSDVADTAASASETVKPSIKADL